MIHWHFRRSHIIPKVMLLLTHNVNSMQACLPMTLSIRLWRVAASRLPTPSRRVRLHWHLWTRLLCRYRQVPLLARSVLAGEGQGVDNFHGNLRRSKDLQSRGQRPMGQSPEGGSGKGRKIAETAHPARRPEKGFWCDRDGGEEHDQHCRAPK